ncbi:MAG: transposase, partial [Patescibacteria group bacterium]
MPYRNKCKTFVPDCYYHLYGRGVNRMDMFLEKEDYRLFCYLLKKYLSPDFKEVKIFKGQRVEVLANSVSGKVELYAFCFMPNHFHLLIKNIEKEGMSKLMTRVLSGYS